MHINFQKYCLFGSLLWFDVITNYLVIYFEPRTIALP